MFSLCLQKLPAVTAQNLSRPRVPGTTEKMIRSLPKSEIRVYDGNGLIMTVNCDDSHEDNFDKNDP